MLDIEGDELREDSIRAVWELTGGSRLLLRRRATGARERERGSGNAGAGTRERDDGTTGDAGLRVTRDYGNREPTDDAR